MSVRIALSFMLIGQVVGVQGRLLFRFDRYFFGAAGEFGCVFIAYNVARAGALEDTGEDAACADCVDGFRWMRDRIVEVDGDAFTVQFTGRMIAFQGWMRDSLEGVRFGTQGFFHWPRGGIAAAFRYFARLFCQDLEAYVDDFYDLLECEAES